MRVTVSSFVLACLLAFATLSCDSGGDDAANAGFSDRPLHGTFNGKAFTLISGYAENNGADGTYDLKLFNIPPSSNNPWDPLAYFGVTHLMVRAKVPARVGRTELFGDLDTWDQKTVTLYDSIGNFSLFAHRGIVEITAIDETSGTLAGRVAASDNEGNEVNGTFSVPIGP